MSILTASQSCQPSGVPRLSLTCTSEKPHELGDVFYLYFGTQIEFVVTSITAEERGIIYTLEEKGNTFGDEPLSVKELEELRKREVYCK